MGSCAAATETAAIEKSAPNAAILTKRERRYTRAEISMVFFKTLRPLLVERKTGVAPEGSNLA
jgi:hypothetical protein